MTIEQVWFEREYIYFKTNNGHVAGNPLYWFPRIADATEAQRLDFEISPFGIHWPGLDEDLSLDGFFNYTGSKVKINIAG